MHNNNNNNADLISSIIKSLHTCSVKRIIKEISSLIQLNDLEDKNTKFNLVPTLLSFSTLSWPISTQWMGFTFARERKRLPHTHELWPQRPQLIRWTEWMINYYSNILPVNSVSNSAFF